MQRRGHGDRVQFGDHQVERGMVQRQRDQGRRQQGTDGTGERADAYPTGEPASGRGQRGVRRLQGGKDDLGVSDQGLPGRGEGDPAASAFQEPDASLPLQGGELLGDRGGRVGVRFGDRRDRAQPGQVAQQVQTTDIKHQLSLRIR